MTEKDYLAVARGLRRSFTKEAFTKDQISLITVELAKSMMKVNDNFDFTKWHSSVFEY